MAANAQRLHPFRLRTAGAVEKQHRRQSELARQVVDDLDRRLPVVVEEAAMGAQHAELQGEAAAMVGAAARRRSRPDPQASGSSAARVRPRSGRPGSAAAAGLAVPVAAGIIHRH